MISPRSILDRAFARAASGQEERFELSSEQTEWVHTIVDHAETQKAILAALVTSLVKKIADPEQDIRLHKVEMERGYSGRSFDTTHVTPFLREKFPRLAMKSGSGWLTRSLEQNHPFTLNFPGKIQSEAVKIAFLQVLHDVEEQAADPELYLRALFARLAEDAHSSGIVVLPTSLRGAITIAEIAGLLHRHFSHPYHTSGASRLPVLALYSVYELIMALPRYQGQTLLPLKSHTTSDTKSRSYGDIEVAREDGTLFEGVEIKHGIAITTALVSDAYDKFAATPVNRYYLLTTAEPNVFAPDEVRTLVEAIRHEHGCEVIVNGVLPSLKYYLRLLPEPRAFLENYTRILQADFDSNTDIKRVHLQKWQELLASLMNEDTSMNS